MSLIILGNVKGKKVNVVFGGSGTNFPAYIGCYKALLEKEIEIAGIVGTSGGSLIASSAALGLSVSEMTDLTEEFFAKFKMPGLLPKLWNSLVYGGLINVNSIKKFLDSTRFRSLTFRNLPKRPELYIASTKMSPLQLEIFSRERSPDLEVTDAMCASLAIPGFFSLKKIRNSYYQDGIVLGGNLLADFFVASNYPTIAFKTRPNKPTAKPKFQLLIVKSLSTAIEGLLLAPELEKIEDAPNAQIVYIDVPNSPLNFNLDYEIIKSLVKAGYTQTLSVLESERISRLLS